MRRNILALALAAGLMAAVFQPMAKAGPGPGAEPSTGLWVTFDVVGEPVRAVVTRPESIEYLLAFIAGSAPQLIPNGLIERGGAFNPPWSWHFVASTVEFAAATTEVCDGTPSFVEAHLEEWLRTVGRYCPWTARTVEIKDCRGKLCTTIFSALTGR